jgi:DNA-binding transcriptional LysR family regulator
VPTARSGWRGRPVELRHLRYFAAVAEELHFGRAATKLHIAQPALSLQIRTLERELGIKLLVRSTRKVELTEAGSVFYERAVSILNAVEASAALAKFTAGNELSKLTISTIYPATFGILPKFIQRLGRKFPNMRINIKSDTTDNIIKDLERGNTNIGFVRLVGHVGTMKYLTISREDYFLAISNDNPLASNKVITIKDLRSQKIISFERSSLTYTEKYFHDVFVEHGLLENIAYTCNDTLSMISLVAAGVGVAFLPEWVEFMPKQNFCLKKVRGIDMRISLGLAWNENDPVANWDEILEIARSFVK